MRFWSDINFLYCLQQVSKETFYNGPMIIVFSLIIAIMLSRDIKARGFFPLGVFFCRCCWVPDISSSRFSARGSARTR